MSINAILKHMETSEQGAIAKDTKPATLNDKERELAERIFFEQGLKECNIGMSEVKFIGRVQLAIKRAKILYKEIYGK